MLGKALGILGGSFDPVHTGHVALAMDVYEQLNLERVIFVPAYIAPHKVGQSYASAQDRYKMTELAVAGFRNFCVSDVELQRGNVSYTVDTMRELRRRYPESQEFYFIIGADSVPQLATWHEIDELFKLVKFAVVCRSGYEEECKAARLSFGKNAERIVLVKTPEYAVSSTQVRQHLAQGLPLDGLVAPAVAQYIKERGLYGFSS